MNDINTLRVTNAERLFLQHINKCFCKRSYRTDRQAREGSSAFTMESTNHKSPKVFTYPLNNRNKRNIRYSRSREYEERSHVCIQKMKNALAQSFDIFVQIVANGPSEELNHRMAVFDDQIVDMFNRFIKCEIERLRYKCFTNFAAPDLSKEQIIDPLGRELRDVS
mmetsp:Transcript_7912/g.8724  ORF Transcript_7912/g.8724 Transcript_7912/m.8724 type:complete len:166 (-) Transcript_7912:319-816(-)